ncbi:response regulator transcription factor [Streptomyces albipurpureus]|uniref:response regulator transcription factor n=1 Tax=Streptomyces albipurpureus TaxID=2897419 RepID=UPI003CE52354
MNRRRLSAREIEVIAHIAQGHNNQQTGEALGISPLTVKAHLRRAFRVLRARDRAHAVAITLRTGVLRVEGIQLVAVTSQRTTLRPTGGAR